MAVWTALTDWGDRLWPELIGSCGTVITVDDQRHVICDGVIARRNPADTPAVSSGKPPMR